MGKSARSKSFSVGLVACVALTTIAVGVFLVGREQQFWEGRSSYWMRFTRTNGLQEGAPVALDGVNVGRVSRMRFPADPRAQYVEVRVSVSSSIAPRIRRDTIGRIQSLGLLGDKYIELTSGTLHAEPLEEGELLRSFDPIDYEAIFGQSGDIVTNVIEVTALLRKVLSDIDSGEGVLGRLVSDREFGRQFADDLSLTIGNVESATRRADQLFDRVSAGEGALGALLTGESRISEIISHLETASNDIAEFSSKLNNGRGAVTRLVTDEAYAKRVLGDVEKASASIAEVSAKVRSGEGTMGKLVYDQTLYDRASGLLGGGGTGGFWRLLGRSVGFFLPFRTGGSQAAAETSGGK